MQGDFTTHSGNETREIPAQSYTLLRTVNKNQYRRLMKLTYTVIFPDNSEAEFKVGDSGVTEIVEPDSRNTGGACFITVHYGKSRMVSYYNLPYIVEAIED